jgi:hypothetical protein
LSEKKETCTPYLDRRNIHFYINCCGFPAILLVQSTKASTAIYVFPFLKQQIHDICNEESHNHNGPCGMHVSHGLWQ